MPEEALRELAPSCAPRWLEPGAYLFHAGEPADNVYVIASGSLEVVRLMPPDAEVILNVLGPRRAVGELAILRGELRSAGVRARGRSRVYALDGRVFLSSIRKWPEAAVAIARSAAETLVRAERDMHLGSTRRLWAVVGGPALPADFGDELARAALPYLNGAAAGRVILWAPVERPAVLREGGARLELRPIGDTTPHDLADLAGEAMGEAGLVVVAAPAAALHEIARRASGVVSAPGVEAPRLPATAKHIQLATDGTPTARRVRVDGLPVPVVAGRVARLLCERSIGVALGGGAARGFAHLGVLEVLEAERLPVDFVTGTSMGAIVGAFWLGNGLRDALAFARERGNLLDWLSLLDPGILVGGLIPTRKMGRVLGARLAARTFSELKVPLGVVALDLDSGQETLFREGPILDALLASSAIPGVVAPHVCRPPDEPGAPHRYVDGGVVNNVPVDAARQMGADRVVGVHAYQRDDPRLARARPGWVARVPTIARALTVVRAQLLGHERNGHRQVLGADLAVLVDTGALGFTDFWRVDELVDAGRRAARGIADEIRLLGP